MPDYFYLLTPAEIAYLRGALGWSQRRLGEALGRDGATISRWESGLYEPEEWAAIALYKLWIDVFGSYDGPYVELEPPSAPVPARSDDALRQFAGLLLAGGIGYLFLRALDSGEDSEDNDSEDDNGG
ncbi:MAG: helix-turn-helix domain-containing protein [Bacteroidota bacterium]